MSIKNEAQKLKESFQFFLSHQDVVNMMNDADVALDDRNVSDTQVFEVWIEKDNGSKIYLRDLQATDKVLFQYVRISNTDGTAEYSEIDVNP